MPIYTFLNLKSEEIETHNFSISNYDEFIKNNPNLQRYHEPGISASIGDPVRLGIRKTDNGFKEVLSKIASANYRSNLTDKLSRK